MPDPFKHHLPQPSPQQTRQLTPEQNTKVNLIVIGFILILTDVLVLGLAFYLYSQNQQLRDRLTAIQNTQLQIKESTCSTYVNDQNQPVQVCATCGNGICEPYEVCTPTGPDTDDCGPLLCQQDCKDQPSDHTLTTDPTWKVFRSLTYNLAFKYPANLTIKETPQNITLSSESDVFLTLTPLDKPIYLELEICAETETVSCLTRLDEEADYVANISIAQRQTKSYYVFNPDTEQTHHQIEIVDDPQFHLNASLGDWRADPATAAVADKLFQEIMVTLEFIDPDSSEEPTTADAAVGLNQIKYSIPDTWTAKVNQENLFLSAQGGGYLTITSYQYDTTEQLTDFLCQTDKDICTDETTFKAVKIGNLDGFITVDQATNAPGPVYFGAKENRFYIIHTFSPPPPNVFEQTYQQVLKSFVF